ncbi:MAG: phage antirepressor [Selenomonadaceae bacterium]|nr:phage antirepressor [Selenomonadaceae bacterium]
MTNIQIFNHEDFGGVRVIEINGQPFFVGADVANALGYADTFGALKKHVDDEDKLVCQIDSAGQKRDVTVINESGVYSLILRSNLPKAKEFKRWVTSEVLPAIRKYGVYATDNFIEKAIADPDFAIRILSELKKTRAECDNLKSIIAANQHKVNYYDFVLGCDDLVSVTKIAKDYGMSAYKFNQLLHELGVQFKQGGVWILYQKFAKHGWAQTKTHNYLDINGEIHCKFVTYWTQKGRRGLYELLKIHGYIPLIEQEAHNG